MKREVEQVKKNPQNVSLKYHAMQSLSMEISVGKGRGEETENGETWNEKVNLLIVAKTANEREGERSERL